MKSIINAADKFTQVATVSVLVLFAVACLFAGCTVHDDDFKPIPAVSATQQTTTEATTEEITATETTAEEETQPELVYLDMGEFKLTAYCSCKECCGIWADGKTATGTVPEQGRTIAVDEDVIPYGYEVIINGHTYIAEDTGSAIVGNCIDIYFDSHADAERFGVKYADVLLKVGECA